MCLSYSNFHSIADNCCKATWSQTELPLAFHGKDNWECLGLYHRNHKNKGFNGDGHSPGLVISRCVACVLAIHAQVLGVGRKGLMAAPRPPCAWQHTGNPQLMNSPVARGETYRRTLHKSKPASISGNNHGFGCTKETVSMSVCIQIKGFDGKRWQEKTIHCIPNKRNPCFRWQRLADLCIRFFQNKESGCKDPRIKGKTCIPKHREQGFWWHDFQFGDKKGTVA